MKYYIPGCMQSGIFYALAAALDRIKRIGKKEASIQQKEELLPAENLLRPLSKKRLFW